MSDDKKKKDKFSAFFASFAESEDQLDYRIAHETVGEKVPVISTGSYALDDALSSGGLPKGRLIQYYGPPGCHARGQGILMADGTIKRVEDIHINDILMGGDGTPRKVLKLIRGKDKMYRVSPIKGDSFIVNGHHVLTLVRNNHKLHNYSYSLSPKFEKIDVELNTWLKWSSTQKVAHKLVRGQVSCFWNSYNLDDPKTDLLPIDSYMLGALIGDGSLQRMVELTTADPEILAEFRKFTFEAKLRLVECGVSGKSKTYRAAGEHHRDTDGRFEKNELFSIIKELGLNVRCENKFVPQIYKSAPKEQRLNVLAGLLDTDGHYSKRGFDFISKSKQLSNDVVFLSRSVGLAAYISECQKSAYEGHSDTYYRVSISGDCSIIPTKLPRKQAAVRQQIKNILYTGFTVEYIGEDEYFGFTLSDDGRYLMDDFTITHNSGKTLMAMIAMVEAQRQDPTAQQVFIDAEQTFDPNWAETLGVDTSRVLLIESDTAANGRKCFEVLLGVPKEDAKTHVLKGKSKPGMLDLIASGEFNINLIVLDSLGSIVPPGEDTSAVGKMNMALLARFLTTTFRKLTLEVNKAQVPFIIINHKRDNMDPYGADHTFSGGNTYAHTLSANVYFEAVQRKDSAILDEKENKIGHPLRATIEKSKFGPWPRKCEFKVNFGVGVIDKHEEIGRLALDYNVVTKPNNVSHEYGNRKWVGEGKYFDAIKNDPTLAVELLAKVNETREMRMEQKRQEQAAKRAAFENQVAAVSEPEVDADTTSVKKKNKKDK